MEQVERLRIVDRPGGASLAVKASPGSSRPRVVGVLGDALKVAVAAPPEKGKANKAIAELLAEALHLSARAVQLASGPANPRKEFLIAGLSADEVRRRLAEL